MGNCHFKTDFDAENITGKLEKTKEYIGKKSTKHKYKTKMA